MLWEHRPCPRPPDSADSEGRSLPGQPGIQTQPPCWSLPGHKAGIATRHTRPSASAPEPPSEPRSKRSGGSQASGGRASPSRPDARPPSPFGPRWSLHVTHSRHLPPGAPFGLERRPRCVAGKRHLLGDTFSGHPPWSGNHHGAHATPLPSCRTQLVFRDPTEPALPGSRACRRGLPTGAARPGTSCPRLHPPQPPQSPRPRPTYQSEDPGESTLGITALEALVSGFVVGGPGPIAKAGLLALGSLREETGSSPPGRQHQVPRRPRPPERPR